MQITNKKFLVYGAGVSGISAYDFLQKKGASVLLYAPKGSAVPDEYNVTNNITKAIEQNFDYVVLSPGVSIIGNKNISKLKKSGAMLITELELGYLFCKGRFIAVTGTNGKTTCVNLINHVLNKNNYKTFLCGNVGTPITSIADYTDENSVVVCEVSSFMLEAVSPNFKPDVSIILNVTPDHISRHKTFDAYYKAKLNITNYQTENDFLFVPKELENTVTKAQKYVILPKKYKSNLIGDFNNLNLTFCEAVCALFGISSKQYKIALKTFNPIKFRLQKVGKKHGVVYINDSKSTNPDSCVKALLSMKKPVVLLLGGSDKGNNFNQIFALKNKIKLALIYGETAPVLENDALFMGYKNTSKYENLKDALNYLYRFVKRGDIVLFSPACASYDEFNNYVERGEFFNNYFNSIK
ncbi:MAG: UDP-N-acetylmuramoyl-L-alanine--D-glutamate ligase [Clostridiales bacterium]|nr:UDP-N-acetylmuramoyl-L-alanine--D-glutamate ligase [Clostridiales bacterium]